MREREKKGSSLWHLEMQPEEKQTYTPASSSLFNRKDVIIFGNVYSELCNNNNLVKDVISTQF